jgi:hypothetical protein
MRITVTAIAAISLCDRRLFPEREHCSSPTAEANVLRNVPVTRDARNWAARQNRMHVPIERFELVPVTRPTQRQNDFRSGARRVLGVGRRPQSEQPGKNQDGSRHV